MRLVRLDRQPSRVADDVRAALASLGRGDTVVGGVALIGARPVGERVLEAVVVLPTGVLVVIGVDLPDPALRLEAPLGAPWVADGWPLVGDDEEAVNPATEALDLAQACEHRIAEAAPGAGPVGTIIAVGPYVETVDQPPADLAGPVRVLHPTPTTMLAAAVSLATRRRPRSIEQARTLITALAPDAPPMSDEVLLGEGFARFTDDSPPGEGPLGMATPPPRPAPGGHSSFASVPPAAPAPPSAVTASDSPVADASGPDSASAAPPAEIEPDPEPAPAAAEPAAPTHLPGAEPAGPAARADPETTADIAFPAPAPDKPEPATPSPAGGHPAFPGAEAAGPGPETTAPPLAAGHPAFPGAEPAEPGALTDSETTAKIAHPASVTSEPATSEPATAEPAGPEAFADPETTADIAFPAPGSTEPPAPSPSGGHPAFPGAVPASTGGSGAIFGRPVADQDPAWRPSPHPRNQDSDGRSRSVRWIPVAAIALLAILVIAAISFASGGNGDDAAPSPAPPTPASTPPSVSTSTGTAAPVTSLQFTPRASASDQRCASHAFGDVQVSLQRTSCAGVRQASYLAQVDGRTAAVTIGIVEFPDAGQAVDFKSVADTPGGGGILDLATETGKWPGQPPSFDGAAFRSKLDGKTVRLVEVAWAPGPSTPDDPGLVRAATAALDLPVA